MTDKIDHMATLALRYGLNPSQGCARLSVDHGSLPISVLSGSPSYINVLDALRAWKLVRELRRRFGEPAAASFKHVNPAGVGLAGELPAHFLHTHFLPDSPLSPLATAYLRARQSDRLATYGDFAALSDVVDEETAAILAKVASDGVIAPGYAEKALAILRGKRQGKYLVLKIDGSFEPGSLETRTEFGLTLVQETDAGDVPDPIETKVVSKTKGVSERARRDLLLAAIVAKHTQSNAVVVVQDGQAIGIGAGQQSRIAATDIACRKADNYRLLGHPKLQDLEFTGGLNRIDKMNTADLLVRFDELDGHARASAISKVSRRFVPITAAEREAWLRKSGPLSLASDAFLPFRDNVDRAARSGVTHILQTGGSIRDGEVTEAADTHEMIMLHSGKRYFLH
jgi:phosphoribosylaminoimidazolecarboxamide formyltransferase / IMP cyclohydrolase